MVIAVYAVCVVMLIFGIGLLAIADRDPIVAGIGVAACAGAVVIAGLALNGAFG